MTTRIRLDSLELNNIQAISDITAFGRTNYAGSLRIAKLYALLAVAYQLQLQWAKPSQTNSAVIQSSNSISSVNNANNARVQRIANNIIEMHIAGIKKRIAQVEAINERKASKIRRDKTIVDLAHLIGDAGSLSRIARLAPSAGLPAIAPETRSKIAAPIIADMNTPSVDETHTNMLAEIEALEATRSPVIVTEITDGLKSIDTGDKLGSAEDWLK